MSSFHLDHPLISESGFQFCKSIQSLDDRALNEKYYHAIGSIAVCFFFFVLFFAILFFIGPHPTLLGLPAQASKHWLWISGFLVLFFVDALCVIGCIYFSERSHFFSKLCLDADLNTKDWEWLNTSQQALAWKATAEGHHALRFFDLLAMEYLWAKDNPHRLGSLPIIPEHDDF